MPPFTKASVVVKTSHHTLATICHRYFNMSPQNAIRRHLPWACPRVGSVHLFVSNASRRPQVCRPRPISATVTVTSYLCNYSSTVSPRRGSSIHSSQYPRASAFCISIRKGPPFFLAAFAFAFPLQNSPLPIESSKRVSSVAHYSKHSPEHTRTIHTHLHSIVCY